MAQSSSSLIAQAKQARLEMLQAEYQAVSRQLEVEGNPSARVRLEAQLEQLEQEMAELEEELRLPDILTIDKPIKLELVRIPAGEFLMGTDPVRDKLGYADEQPQHTVTLPDYYIAKYPTTNEQYAVFVESEGHDAPGYWTEGSIPSGKADHPVVYVSWHDAMAFCDWLTREAGRQFRLPSEAEWEKAARGTDGRIYPWGYTFDARRCNCSEAGIGDTTAVGRYSEAGGDSPYGVADMAGNVLEWTLSLGRKRVTGQDLGYPYDPVDGREDPSADGLRVLRGGAFSHSRERVRCAMRAWQDPYPRIHRYGFRVCTPS